MASNDGKADNQRETASLDASFPDTPDMREVFGDKCDDPVFRQSWLDTNRAIEEAGEQASKELQAELEPTVIEDGIDSEFVAYLRETDQGVETDSRGRICKLWIGFDQQTESLPTILGRIAPLQRVQFLKLVGSDTLDDVKISLPSNALLALARWNDLKHLHLEPVPIEGEAIAKLVSAGGLSQLEVLHAYIGGGTDVLLEAIQNCQKIRELHISGSDLTDTGLSFVSGLHDLESLDASDTAITGRGLNYLKPLIKLRELQIEDTEIGDIGFSYLSNLKHLEELYTSCSKVTDEGLLFLSDLSNLKDLSLSGANISLVGIEHLLPLTNLQTLFLDDTQLGDEVLPILSQMQHLRNLFLMETKITARGVKSLQADLYHCDIVH